MSNLITKFKSLNIFLKLYVINVFILTLVNTPMLQYTPLYGFSQLVYKIMFSELILLAPFFIPQLIAFITYTITKAIMQAVHDSKK